jgi:hypothetical protein
MSVTLAKGSLPSHLGETRWTFVLTAFNSMAPAEATNCSVLLIVARYRESQGQRSTAMLSCLHGSTSQIFSESSGCAMTAMQIFDPVTIVSKSAQFFASSRTDTVWKRPDEWWRQLAQIKISDRTERNPLPGHLPGPRERSAVCRKEQFVIV